MYAVIKTGGKQYRVQEGQIIRVEKLECEEGKAIDFDQVLMIGNGEDVKIGAPNVDGAKVSAKVIEHGRLKKIKIIKFKRRKHHEKQAGHRQYFTAIKIEEISA